jgi:hypothetical protein
VAGSATGDAPLAIQAPGSPEPGTAGEAALAEPAGGTADSVPSAVGAAGQTSAAAVPPRSATPPTAAATPPPPVGAAEIVFDTNSSFLPRGAGKELSRLVAGLPKARGYEVELTATVGAAADAAEAKDPAEAARYDRWLAERRLGRVAEWIEKNAPVRELSVRRGFVENDPSRRIIVRVRPVP